LTLHAEKSFNLAINRESMDRARNGDMNLSKRHHWGGDIKAAAREAHCV
jgi:hypothetical protein